MGDGFFHLFHWRGVPVKGHWAVLALGVLQIALGKSPLRLVGFAAIILVHELGHALLVKRYGLRVREILIHPFGGECVHDATSSARQNVVIAWGGVLAQLALMLAVGVPAYLMGGVREPWLSDLVDVLTVSNAFMAAFNLLPIRPLDGYTAWQLKRLFGRVKVASKVAKKPVRKGHLAVVPPTKRDQIDALVDDALERARKSTKDRERP